MSEEEKTALEFIKINNKHRYCDKNDVDFLLNLIENQQKELNNLKEIEKSHKEENGKLRVEFEKVYEDNLTLAHELEQEKEKNMQLNQEVLMYKNAVPNQYNFFDYSNYISKDKIKEKIKELDELIKEAKDELGTASKEFTIYVYQKDILKQLSEEK